jgi:hypothetical protein
MGLAAARRLSARSGGRCAFALICFLRSSKERVRLAAARRFGARSGGRCVFVLVCFLQTFEPVVASLTPLLLSDGRVLVGWSP